MIDVPTEAGTPVNGAEGRDPVRDFYDRFSARLLRDYVHGNSRAVHGIRHALRWLPPRASRILDVGCGIGFSAHEIKRRFPQSHVVGMDLSPRLVDIAAKLHAREGLEFVAGDVTEASGLTGSFDAIVMLDVYEHIPCERRPLLWIIVSRLLNPEGRVILAYPSPANQADLLAHHPHEVQPVDETVTPEDLETFAERIGGVVAWNCDVTIWRGGDYVHACIIRGVSRETVVQLAARASAQRPPELEDGGTRRVRVEQRMEQRVSRHGVLLAAKRGAPTIGVALQTPPGASETFLLAHMSRLPAQVIPLWGTTLEMVTDANGQSLSPLARSGDWPRRLTLGIRRRMTGPEAFAARAMKRYLCSQRVSTLLAEYGRTGLLWMDVCRETRIPMVVHFHGVDAYQTRYLSAHGARYPELFASAAAIVAVSPDMQQQLVRMGAPPWKVHCNACGVDTDVFVPTDPAMNPPNFVAVGRLVDKKAPYLTILAFSKVAAAVSDATLTIIGDGPLAETCHRLASCLGVGGAVRLQGARDHQEVVETLRGARAFVQHSVRPKNGDSAGDSEGTPVAVLEAGASGLPVVATRHGGLPDAVSHGETGFLVDEGDVDGMARFMESLARDPAMASRMGMAARSRVVAHFSMDRSMARLWEIIRQVGRQGAGARRRDGSRSGV